MSWGGQCIAQENKPTQGGFICPFKSYLEYNDEPYNELNIIFLNNNLLADPGEAGGCSKKSPVII